MQFTRPGYSHIRDSGQLFARTSFRVLILLIVLCSLAVTAGLLLSQSPTASALTTVPTKMNFQGRLTDASGNIKPNGTYNMRLKLYTVSTAGSAVWSEDRLVSATQGVQVTNGLFSIQLGEITSLPASLFASGALYLEVELPTPATATSASPTWTEGPMTPRNQMATSAYAYNSETLDGQDGDYYTNAANLTGTVSAARLAGSYTGITGTGALTAGSIGTGFGTIVTGNTITGTVLNGTTGINTGAGAGTQRIDASGNLVNIGNATMTGVLTQGGYQAADAATGNMVVNGDFERNNTTGWTGVTDVVTGGHTGNYAARFVGPRTLESSDYIPVDPTRDVLQLEAYIKKSAAGATPGTLYFGYKAYTASKTVIGTAPCGSYCYFAASANVVPVDGAWHKYSATTTGEGTVFPNFPVGTKYVRVLGLINYGASTDAETLVDHVTLKRINHGSLFVGNNFNASNMVNQFQQTQLYTTASNVFTIQAPASGDISIQGSKLVSTVSGGAYLQGGDDAALHDVNVANTVGIYGIQDASQGCIRLGNSGASAICGSSSGTNISGNVYAGTAFHSPNWFYSTGDTGWYNSTYGGGWRMQDATWIRSYGSKYVYMDVGFDTGAASGVGCGGGLGGGYTFQVCGSQVVTGGLVSSSSFTVGNANFAYGNPNSLTGIYLCKRTADNIVAMGSSCSLASSARYKENISSITSEQALDILSKLRAVGFDWKSGMGDFSAANGGKSDYGVIAEEVEKILPELVNKDANGQTIGVNYTGLIPFLIKAVQEQQSQIVQLQGGNPVYSSLAVNGPATVDRLTVLGDAHVKGDITIGGHLVSGGSAPSVDASLATCLENIVVTGTDTAGTLRFSVNSAGCTSADMGAVFTKVYGAAPHATLTAKDRDSARLQSSLDTDTHKMTFTFDGMQIGKTYRFTYHVIQ